MKRSQVVLLMGFVNLFTQIASSQIKKNNNDQTFVGYWKIVDVPPALRLNPMFRNTCLELHDTRVGISISDSANTINNVKFFTWHHNSDTLFIDTLHNETRHRILSALTSISNDTLFLKILTTGKISGKPLDNSFIILKKIKNNPLGIYNEWLPTDNIINVTGKWLKAYQVKDGHVSNLSDQFWDIHPSNNNFGEIIMTPSNAQTVDILKELNFVKYSFAQGIFAATSLKINPDKLKSDTTKHYEFNLLTNKPGTVRNVFCHSTDGVIILEYEGGEILYLVYVGEPMWSDVSALHDEYRNRKGVALQNFGVHYQYCTTCGGSGIVSETVQNSEPDREQVGSEYGRPVYEMVYHNHIENRSCNVCDGKGWYYENDDAPIQYDASLKYSPTTGTVGSDFIPKAYVKISGFLTYSFIKCENESIVCTTTYKITRPAEWLILPVQGTEFFLIKSRTKESYLKAEQHIVELSPDSTSEACLWKMQISPNNDLYYKSGTSGKIWNKASNEFLYLNDGKLLTSSDVWEHLASSMWSIKKVSEEEMQQDNQ